MPVISVIIPAYNAERTILETIHSVLTQSFSDFELIVINDGSTDKTLSLVSSISDPRLKVFSYPNGGLPVARNRGIERSTGQFISFLDADDLWTPDKLEYQLLAFQADPNAGVAYSWTKLVDFSGKIIADAPPFNFEGEVIDNLLLENFIGHGSNILVKREAVEKVGDFDPNLNSAADWDFYLRLASHYDFILVPEYQIYYRQSSSSMSSKADLIKRDSLDVVEKAFQSLHSKIHLKNQSLAGVYQYSGELYLRHSGCREDIQKAKLDLWSAFIYHPPILLKNDFRKLVKWCLKELFNYRVNAIRRTKIGKLNS